MCATEMANSRTARSGQMTSSAARNAGTSGSSQRVSCAGDQYLRNEVHTNKHLYDDVDSELRRRLHSGWEQETSTPRAVSTATDHQSQVVQGSRSPGRRAADPV